MAVEREAARGKADIEHLSSLIDGELDPEVAAALIAALCRDPELQRQWSDLQLVGDALRSSDVAACHVEGFCQRVRSALIQEPTVLAPRPTHRFAARRYVIPGAAIAASIAAIAFVAMPLLRPSTSELAAQSNSPPTTPATAVVQNSPAAEPSEAKAAVAIANARALDPYVAAHRELTAGTPLPRATAYLRTSGGER